MLLRCPPSVTTDQAGVRSLIQLTRRAFFGSERCELARASLCRVFRNEAWARVDLVERVVKLDPGTTKNDEGRTLPLDGDLYESLAFQRQVRDECFPECPWVFFAAGKPLSKNFRSQWAKAAKAAATREHDQVTTLWDSEREKPAKLFHDLRRTGVRNLVRAGVPERVAISISGHKTRSVFDRYNVVNERDIRDAGHKLTEYLRSKDEHEGQEAGSTPIHKAHRDLSKTLN